ncbi:hypothetical protein LTR78_008667 [Recurvomyces mirabilis]|uniref:ATP-grasp domain-containing protein n=1 Tax=Recurvomyces mirabilis TaxID=574656 RepID=A0AAE0TPI2_9PEZI|nr:hypothetical protein LTR78_008667 [Recurvomyces mirabilis]KAK5159248.1 hypothetical protein LTS14_002390 [Recurvomyces mirabilis]
MPHKIEPARVGAWDAEFLSKDGDDCIVDSVQATSIAASLRPGAGIHRFDSIKVFSEGGRTMSTCKVPTTPSVDAALSLLWSTALSKPGKSVTKFLLPPGDGYIVRSDLMDFSLKLCPAFTTVQGFVQPAQQITGARLAEGEKRPRKLLRSSVGVATVADDADPQAAQNEFQARLSWPWTILTPIKHTRIALIEESRREVFCKEFYTAARAMAISVVILDEPGHWAEDDNGSGAKYREHFVPFVRGGCPVDELPGRIVDTIRGLPYKIDGVMALYDMLMPAVAQAAETLGLPTLGSAAYLASTDKYETRKLAPVSTVMKVESLDDLESQLKTLSQPLQYPLIVKPTRSHAARGVERVNKEEDLREALRNSFACQSQEHDRVGVSFDTSSVIVETYCDGPEVDVNMMLWNGEVLHAEVVDNFQKHGEAVTQSFGSFGSSSPSALPEDEVEMLKRDMADIVRRLGLHSGVIHAEARVHNSAYKISEDKIGVRPRKEPKVGPSGTFLLEVNPRFAGWFEAVLSSYVFGIDYFAGYLMQCIGDEARFRALAHGFGNAPTYHYTWLPQKIETDGSGIMPNELGLEALGIADTYATHRYFWKPGDVVPPRNKRPAPGAGFMMLRSDVSAQDAWRTWAKARQGLEIHLE